MIEVILEDIGIDSVKNHRAAFSGSRAHLANDVGSGYGLKDKAPLAGCPEHSSAAADADRPQPRTRRQTITPGSDPLARAAVDLRKHCVAFHSGVLAKGEAPQSVAELMEVAHHGAVTHLEPELLFEPAVDFPPSSAARQLGADSLRPALRDRVSLPALPCVLAEHASW